MASKKKRPAGGRPATRPTRPGAAASGLPGGAAAAEAPGAVARAGDTPVEVPGSPDTAAPGAAPAGAGAAGKARGTARADHRQQQAKAKEQQRLAKERARRREALRRRLKVGAAVAVVVVAAGGYVAYDRRQDAALRDSLEASGACKTDERSDPTNAAGQNHVPPPGYSVDPPAGGNHAPGPARSGTYAGESVPQDPALVHSLEHGYVVVWHASDLEDADKKELEEFVEAREPDAILAERASLDVPVAATAWGQRLLCEEIDLDALEAFHDAHVGNGPEDVGRT